MIQSDRKSQIIRHSLLYTASRYIAQFFNFFTAIFMKRFLGPFYTGVWSLLKVVIDYGMFADLGSQTAVAYKIPFLKGKGDDEKAKEITGAVYNFTSLVTIIASAAIFIYTIWFHKIFSHEMLVGLLVVSVLLIIQRTYTYYIVLLRANKDFDVLSKSIIFDAVINICLVLIIVSKFKLYGLYAIALILPVLNVWYIRRYKKYDIRLTFKMPDIWSHIKFGVPLFLANILKYILYSIDKIMIAAMLDLRQLGFYSLALMSKNYSEDISKNFSHIIIPYMLEDYGREEDLRKVSKYVTLLTLITSYLMAIVLSLIYIVAPPFVIYVLPKFIPGILAMKIFLLATFFTGITVYSFNYLIALNKQTKLLVPIILTILINVIFNYLFIKGGLGIAGVAFATAISGFISFCIILGYAMKHFATAKEIIKFFCMVLFPLLYCAAFLFIIEYFLNFKNIITTGLIKTVIFILTTLPILYILDRQTKVFRLAWKILFNASGSAKNNFL